ncbi:bcl-2-like protein 1 [Scomber japonicus]|uniref:bcl-2-like protein 1 n=1 Tax=Scomber japonicus TaxID=13676 RepID=UPI0023057B02|nr:bcl-2-like protein 1 [Scomber japonicus]XP_053171724.1 bcl-2-like protein 1 [Scomber japonicus]XP_053171725.1 bcl-2-like protein 1 [Scomber japonicus]XP_053171726.1 bcl-2-like protein 1 [Scomber japonicus]
MPYSNRELVEFFIGHKLSQKDYPTSLLRPEDASGRTEKDKATTAASNGSLLTSRNGSRQLGTSSSPHGDIEAVKAALRDSADKFELLFTEAFSDLSSQIDITPETAYHSFKSVMDEVFKDGVNWGRVVGLFTFGGAICVKCVERNMSDLVSRIVDWMTIYLDEHINPWIQSQGGWDCFVELFGREAAVAGTTSRDSLRRCLLAGAALLMGVLVGVLIAKKQ